MTDPDAADSTRGESHREASRAWRERNSDLHHAMRREWKILNSDRSRELNREEMRRAARRKKEAEERKARQRGYYWAHADERRAYAQMYILRRTAEDPDGFPKRRREAQRAWYRRHRERLLAKEHERYRQDPASKRDYARDYYQRHKEDITANRRAYYFQNKEKIAERQRAWHAEQRRRTGAGLPKRNLHRTPRPERQANARAATLFFEQHVDAAKREELLDELRTPPHLYAEWKRDCLRARAAHYAAVTPLPPPRPPTAEEVENARLDNIARTVNARLRAEPHRPQPTADPAAPLFAPSASTTRGMNR